MSLAPLPYIARADEEARLCDFLLTRLQGQHGVPKAVVLCGPPGVGKQTLLRRVWESERGLRGYRLTGAVTDQILGSAAPVDIRKAADKAVEVAGEIVGVPSAAVGAALKVAYLLLGKDRLLDARGAAPAEVTLDHLFLERVDQPVLIVVPGIDPGDTEALQRYASLVREAHDRKRPLALVFIDDSLHWDDEGRETYLGLAGLRRSVGDERKLEVVPVRPLSDGQCRETFARLGLSAEWGNVLYQFSDGGLGGLAELWETLQKNGVFTPAGNRRWNAVHPAAAGAVSEVIRDRLLKLVRARMPKGADHAGLLADACELAASMGASFLPQAVAECVFEAAPNRGEIDRDAWEDLWYDVLEREDAEHPALASPSIIDGDPEILHADERRMFVYRFRDPALVNLLRSHVRRAWRERDGAGETKESTYSQLAKGSQTLDAWLEQNFHETWERTIPFRAALLRARNRDWEASRLEDIGSRLQLRDSLREQAERERLRVAAGRDARGLYACLSWYADTLLDLGLDSLAAEALGEAKELVDAGRVAPSAKQRSDLLHSLGLALFHQGRLPQARTAILESVRLSTELFGADHPETLARESSLAAVLYREGLLDEAERMLRHVVDSLRFLKGPEHRTTVDAVHNLSMVLMKRGRHDEAESLQRWELEVRERLQGPEHSDTLTSASSLAHSLEVRGALEEAEPLYRRVLHARERLLGPKHPYTLISVSDLAHLLEARGALEEAEMLYRRALRLRESVLGLEHQDTLTSANNLASVLIGQRRLEEAEPLYRRALAGLERVLGPEHPEALAPLANLASVLYLQGRLEEAEPLCRRALDARECVLGMEHSATLTSVHHLAHILQAQGKLEEAEPLYRRALEGRERVLGPEHPDTLTSVDDLAQLLETRGMPEEAETLYWRALTSRERVLEPDHPNTLASVHDLAYLLQSRGKLEEAEPLFRRALEGSERVNGPEHLDTATLLHNLACMLNARGALEEAEPLWRRALEGLERELGPEHPHTRIVRESLAVLWREMLRP